MFRYSFRINESDEDPSLVAPYATEESTASFLLCAQKHKFSVLERRSCSAYFMVQSVPNNFGGDKHNNKPGGLPILASSRQHESLPLFDFNAQAPSASRSVSSWLRHQLELKFWPANFAGQFEEYQPEQAPSSTAVVQADELWDIEREPVRQH